MAEQRPGVPDVRPGPLTAAAAAVAVEAVLVAGFGVLLLREVLAGAALEASGGVVQGVLALLVGAGLAVGARALWRRRGAARGPLLVWQLLQAAISLPALGEGWVPAVLVVLAVVAGVGMVVPTASEALER